MASLPLGSILPETLRSTSQQISFDPLALLAVLHNPRAAASAARLYNQPSPEVFKWPHTMMIGGALPPFKLLVDHLVSQRKSVHPAIEMCRADQGRLEVQSDVPIIKDIPFLPIRHGNFWLADILAYSPSEYPRNDIVIVNLESLKARSSSGLERLCLHFITTLTGLLLVAGSLLSVLGGDMWSTVLFFVYFLHWIASVAVSLTVMVGPEDSEHKHIREDGTQRHAIYTRPEGGKVIFVGRQDMLERWARTTYAFYRSTSNNVLNWLWMATGALACAASVICMVNMAAWFQLAYLGTLAISSISELVITILVRRIQNKCSGAGMVCNTTKSNKTWSQAVIRASLEVSPTFSLADLDWIALGALPDFPVFRNMCKLLPLLRSGSALPFGALDLVAPLMDGENEQRRNLANRIAHEIVSSRSNAGAADVVKEHALDVWGHVAYAAADPMT